ncbi:MAG TPA: SRPBCC family protein [bacterium]|nr:SRPBCC family protein [bacterium]
MKIASRICVLPLFVILFMAFAGADIFAAEEPPSWKDLDIEVLAKLLEDGELTSVDYVGPEKLEMCSIGILADAPPEKVWEAITDFAGYEEMMPDMSKGTVLESGDNWARVRFDITVLKLSLISITTDYVLRYDFDPPRRADVSWESGKVKNVNGYWELFPIDGGKRTVVIYAITSDLESANALAGAALKKQPSMVMAINLSSAIVLTRVVKQKAERLAGEEAENNG